VDWGYLLGKKDRLNWRSLLSDGCETGSAYERVDFMAMMPFAMMVGLHAGLQAVCTRLLARLHGVLARGLAYSQISRVQKHPCLQAERMSFASRYR
jgi:hypothetical protein